MAKRRLAIFLGAMFACTLLSLAVAPRPIPQDQSYHAFADTRALGTIPNAADVLSNAGFLIVGSRGLLLTRRIRKAVPLCIGVVLTALGSAFYHWNPSDATLVATAEG